MTVLGVQGREPVCADKADQGRGKTAVVFHDEDAALAGLEAFPVIREGACLGWRWRGGEVAGPHRGSFARKAHGHEQGQGAAKALETFQHQVAPHPPGELPRNGQSEPGTAETPAGIAFCLLEGLEYLVEFGPGNADAGILHREGPGRRPEGVLRRGDHGGFQGDAPPFGELDGVGQEVLQDLPSSLDIRAQAEGRIGVHVDLEIEALDLGQGLEDGDHRFHQPGQGHLLENIVHVPGLDLGDIQDVIDQGKQIVTGAMDGVGEVHLLFREVSRLVVRQQPRQDHEAVQGRPQFVRHVGQEL